MNANAASTTTPIQTPSPTSSRPRRVARVCAAVLLVLAGAWTILARQAGTFIPDRSAVAIHASDPQIEPFSQRKQLIDVGPWRVAYIDEGQGEPVFLLHGCPFHAFEWRDVIPRLSAHYRVIAPDLLGLGDTQVRLTDDYRLPEDAEMVVGLMDALGIEDAAFVAHDHGAATVQILMGTHPERLRKVVLTNAEAYDQWPSEPERPYLKLVVNPVLSPLFRFALTFTSVQHEVFDIAVHDQAVFTDEVVNAYTRAHTATPARWQRLVRFFRWQLDREHNMVTMQAVDGMRRFDKPTLLLWGKQDTNFGPAIAERLAGDIPGAEGIVWFEHSAHMPMQEEPEKYANAVLDFLGSGGSEASGGAAN